MSTEGDLRWLRLGTGGADSEAANEHCMKSGLRGMDCRWGKQERPHYSMPGRNIMTLPSLIIVYFLLTAKFGGHIARAGGSFNY